MDMPKTAEPPQLPELEPDAWERFERAVDAVVKSGPQHRTAQKHELGDPGLARLYEIARRTACQFPKFQTQFSY